MMVALCPNNNEVHIYKSSQDQWERLHVLEKHDQIVSGIDWSSKSNKIVTVSHDRNSWVSKLIRKRHESSVTNVAWHPNNILLATTSTDGKCRVFSTFIKGVDTNNACDIYIPSTRSSNTRELFSAVSLLKQQILQLDLSYSWAFGVKWSPSGNTLAYVGHSSMIYFVDDVGPSPLAQSVAFRDLPLRDVGQHPPLFYILRTWSSPRVLFISEKMVIGVGYDSNPMELYKIHRREESGIFRLQLQFAASLFSEAFGKFYGQSKAATANDASESSKSRGGVHDNCINSIVPLSKAGSPKVMRFSTSGLDGKIAIWDLENMQEELGHQF
ncbi:unnamed protein product [Thlaspi arvense]|uniref:Arp2/3 complex 41 kDa subunit n=1 Tax=Thlaspi arvense TaxID=13288 RepID=A0AAU9SBM2_THLAR|nr:unnamed protein product [Thlaspi arvense]